MGGSVSRDEGSESRGGGGSGGSGVVMTQEEMHVFKKLKKAITAAASVSSATSSGSSDSDDNALRERAKFLTNAKALCDHLANNRWKTEGTEELPSDAMFGNEDRGESDLMRVRLIVSTSSNVPDSLLRAAAMIARPEYGIVHTGLILGNTLVDWLGNSLCSPRKVSSRRAMMVINLGSLDMSLRETMDRLKRLSEVIVRWNLEKTYSTTKANCQQFVIAALDVLGMPRRLPGQLGDFMERLKEGHHELTFKDPLVSDLSQTFTSHRMLDVYVDDLLDRVTEASGCDPTTTDRVALFQERFPGDWELLVAFDRAFWAAHVTNAAEPNNAPRTKVIGGEEQTACPIELSDATREMLKRPVWMDKPNQD